MSYSHLQNIPTLYLAILVSFHMSQMQNLEYNKQQDAQLLEVIAEKHVMTILQGITNYPKSARTISAEYGISLSTVYRRLEELLKRKLLFTSGVIDKDGKKHFLYQSKVKKLSIQFDQDDVKVEMTHNHK